MATPVGHSLVAGLFYLEGNRSNRIRIDLPLLSFYILFANAPDLDFLPGILIGEPSHFHHGLSHSLGFGILFTLTACIILKKTLKWFPKHRLLYLISMGYLLYLSHLLVDLITLDNGFPYGMPIFWPISNHYINIPFYVFSNVLHLKGAINLHNLKVALHEIMVFTPPLFYLIFVTRRFYKIEIMTKFLLFAIIMGIIMGVFIKTNPFYQ